MDTDSSFRPTNFSPRKVVDGTQVPSTSEVAQRRILVAEDDSLSRKIICKFLGGWGFQTVEATDGAALKTLVETDLARWREVVRSAGITAG
jgi:hypothetical protein